MVQSDLSGSKGTVMGESTPDVVFASSQTPKKYNVATKNVVQDKKSLVTEEYTNNLIKVFKQFVLEEYGTWPNNTTKLDELKDDIAQQLQGYNNAMNPKKGLMMKTASKAVVTRLNLRKIKFDVISGKVSPRLQTQVRLHNSVQEHLKLLIGLFSNLKENPFNFKDNENWISPVCEKLLENNKEINRALIDIDRLFPPAAAFFTEIYHLNSALQAWKVVFEPLYDESKLYCGRVLPLDNTLLSQGQYLQLGKKEVGQSLYQLHCELFHLASTFISHIRVISPDNALPSRINIIAIVANLNEILKKILDLVLTLNKLFEFVVPNNAVAANDAEIEKDVEGGVVEAEVDKTALVWRSISKKASKVSLIHSPPEVEIPDISPDDPDFKFRPGTVDNFVLRIISNTDRSLLRAFLVGYQTFCSPTIFWDKLLDYYFNISQEKEDRKLFEKRKIANLILIWIKEDFYGINDHIIVKIKKFATEVLPKDGFGDISNAIMQEIGDYRFVPEFKEFFTELTVFDLEDIKSHQFWFRCDKKDMAQQLTIVDWEIFQQVQFSELSALKWTREKVHIFAQNILNLLRRVNQISFWVASFILVQETIQDRVKAIMKMTGLATALIDIKNYNSLMGVLAGLGLTCVSRLKRTFDALPKKTNEKLKRMAHFQDPAGGFRFLRNYTKDNGALLPYLGTYLSDLVNMEENADTVEVAGVSLINFYKYQMISKSINTLLQHSSTSLTFEKQSTLHTFLSSLPTLSESELYKMSLEREPRESQHS
uniref:Ras-GEF domain-containing protein n=1 Tax=Arcella intermedia TaxID=1963864 RepID=A0A6B2KYJ5_9EUKA